MWRPGISRVVFRRTSFTSSTVAWCRPSKFAEMLAEELERREETEPRGELPVEAAAAIASRRAFYEVRAAHSPDTRHWCSRNSTAWTVVYEADPRFQLSCLNRFIYVKGVKDLTEALQNAESVRGQVSTVGLAAPEDKAQALATELARWGVARVCRLGQMQEPPLAWRHDGRPALGDLVTWTDWELESAVMELDTEYDRGCGAGPLASSPHHSSTPRSITPYTYDGTTQNISI